MINEGLTETEIRHGHLFCGIGGGAIGFNRGQARVGHVRAKFVCVGGIDVDAAACRDFERNVGVAGTCLDLFSLEQYLAFHGGPPTAGWKEAMPADIHAAFGWRRPHIVFLSAPCKGFSGLLSETASKTQKYQALNGLTLRGIWLLLEAYKDDPVELIIFENVPRIATRGRQLLDQILALFRAYGYAANETAHDCGELGNLAQSRKRFLLVARHLSKVPSFLHEPEKHRLRGVGEVLDQLPLPLSGMGGPMHRMPALQWKTWVRLAFVRAGGDWRSLNDLAVEGGVLRDFGIVPAGAWNNGTLGVRRWIDPARTVTGKSGSTSGGHAVADPRVGGDGWWERCALGVNDWNAHSGAITANGRPGSGAFSVADPRAGDLASADRPAYGVNEWEGTGATVTSARSPGQGRCSVADPRYAWEGAHQNKMAVRPWNGHAKAVTGSNRVGSGAQSVADPRPPDGGHGGKYRVTGFKEHSGTVISASTTGNGAFAVADPRTGYGPSTHHNVLKVTEYDSHARTITASNHPSGGALSVADPRLDGEPRRSTFGVRDWTDHAGVIRGESHPSNGAFAVSDPRVDGHPKSVQLGVRPWGQPAGVVTGKMFAGGGPHSVADPRLEGKRFNNVFRIVRYDAAAPAVAGPGGPGGLAVADPRPPFTIGGRENYLTSGHYGVVAYEDPSRAVTGTGQHDNGFNSVADPRYDDNGGAPGDNAGEKCGQYQQPPLPAPAERLVCVIAALDGTWHRPFTTLELAALQGLVDPTEQFELDGLSDASWRERIGNCVPPPSAQAIAGVMGETLLLSWAGETFKLSNTPIWVRNVAVALSVQPERPIE